MQNVNEMPACIQATIAACVHAVVEGIGAAGDIESLAGVDSAWRANIAESACNQLDHYVTMPDGAEVPMYYVVRRFFDELISEMGGY